MPFLVLCSIQKTVGSDIAFDVVMEKVKEVSVPSVEVSADEGLKVAKKGKDTRRHLKKEDGKQGPKEVEDVGSKRCKGKKGEVKEGKKNSVKGLSDDGENLVGREIIPDTTEEKKSKGEKWMHS